MTTKLNGKERSRSRARSITILVLAIVVVIAAVVYREQAAEPQANSTEEPGLASVRDGRGPERDPKRPADSPESMSVEPGLALDQAVAAFDAAQARHVATESAVDDALVSLAVSERALEDLERFVEDLESRGEDPAEHAEEGMKRFNPAFEAYERAMNELENAESDEAIERIKLLGAEQELKAARRRTGLESSTR